MWIALLQLCVSPSSFTVHLHALVPALKNTEKHCPLALQRKGLCFQTSSINRLFKPKSTYVCTCSICHSLQTPKAVHQPPTSQPESTNRWSLIIYWLLVKSRARCPCDPMALWWTFEHHKLPSSRGPSFPLWGDFRCSPGRFMLSDCGSKPWHLHRGCAKGGPPQAPPK